MTMKHAETHKDGCHLYHHCLNCPLPECYLVEVPDKDNGGYPGDAAYSKPHGRKPKKEKTCIMFN